MNVFAFEICYGSHSCIHLLIQVFTQSGKPDELSRFVNKFVTYSGRSECLGSLSLPITVSSSFCIFSWISGQMAMYKYPHIRVFLVVSTPALKKSRMTPNNCFSVKKTRNLLRCTRWKVGMNVRGHPLTTFKNLVALLSTPP